MTYILRRLSKLCFVLRLANDGAYLFSVTQDKVYINLNHALNESEVSILFKY